MEKKVYCEICEKNTEKIIRCSICKKKLCTDCAGSHDNRILCQACNDYLVKERVSDLMLWARLTPDCCCPVCPECDRDGFTKDELEKVISLSGKLSKTEGSCPKCGGSTMYQVNVA